jgi:hypothetical protein
MHRPVPLIKPLTIAAWSFSMAASFPFRRPVVVWRGYSASGWLPGVTRKNGSSAIPAPTTDVRLKKRIVRTLIREVIADIDAEGGTIMLLLHWMGGVHAELRLPRRRRGQRGSTRPTSSPRSGNWFSLWAMT